MDKLFLQIINMSITSSYVILFIIITRLFLKKLPRVFSPIAFGENNTKTRIKNILNYKKPKFWVVIVSIIVIIVLSIGLLSNPKSKEMNSIETSEDLTVEDVANEFIKQEIESYENPRELLGDFKIIDSKITKLENVHIFDDILPYPLEIWALEYRLKPDDMSKVSLAGGMQEEDGWITEDTSMGKPILVFSIGDEIKSLLGILYTEEFGFDTLSKQEMSLRIMLERKGLLPNETYEGNHTVIKFPLSTGETSQLLLSQPTKQGKDGIWVVERWMDGQGLIYYEIPILEENIRAKDYYGKLQKKVEEGEDKWLLDPVEVGYNFIIDTLGQSLVRKENLEIINPATIEDFLKTPESHYIGYITMMTLDENIFDLDRVEFLTQEDEERAEEIGIDVNVDMPSGFYIYNPDTYPTSLDVSDNTEYLLLNWEDLSQHNRVTKEEFIQYNDDLNYDPLYNTYTKDGYVTKIEEQYIP